MKVKQGDKAPEIDLPDQNGEKHKLSGHAGEWVLVYFYPRDNTPGCTKEACTIRDNFDNLEGLGVTVLGISADSVDSHKKFAKKHNLPFTLLADEGKKVVKKYGVWVEKSMFGKKYMGIKRTSFLIGPDGTIKKVYKKVKPVKHAQEVIADVKQLKQL